MAVPFFPVDVVRGVLLAAAVADEGTMLDNAAVAVKNSIFIN